MYIYIYTYMIEYDFNHDMSKKLLQSSGFKSPRSEWNTALAALVFHQAVATLGNREPWQVIKKASALKSQEVDLVNELEVLFDAGRLAIFL